MPRELNVEIESWPIRGVFRISRGARTEAQVVVVTIRDGDVIARGESAPNARYNEDVESVSAEIRDAAGAIGDGITREELLGAMHAGAARNALDCALWDLEAKLTGTPIWQLAGLSGPIQSVVTAYTLSVDSPEAMGRAAAENASRPLLKLKMTGDGADLDRVARIHENAPNARLIVDANEAWSVEFYLEIAAKLGALGVEMIEQPLPAGDDEGLRGIDRPLMLCADESCHDSASLDALVGKYDRINIKLDKTGGLTEALKLKAAAEAKGMGIMVGCMIGTSLSMAPGMVVAQGAQVVDLDAPLLLTKDREPGLLYTGSTISPPERELWG
jgi:L-alanine-DL-glutamate epimerase-like enolase superfamily enzyme